MPDIFSYTDYRTFIKDWYDETNQSRPGITYRDIAKKAGYNSPAHITMILKGKTNLSPAHIVKFSSLLELKKKEAEYFSLLVHYNQAKSASDKKCFFDKMVKYKETGTTLLSADQYEYYQKWYYAAIHDILSFFPFKNDYHALAKMVEPSITPREAEKAVALLLHLGFISRTTEGAFTCNAPSLSAYSEGRSLALSTYAREMMERARAALDMRESDERSISWAGFSMSKAVFDQVKEETRAFRKRVLELARSDRSPERAYHINIQIFPVSKQYLAPSGKEAAL